MKLSHEEVLLLMVNINPIISHLEHGIKIHSHVKKRSHYREACEKRLNEILALQVRLNDYHDTTMQLEHEANQE
jgi:hypothetical protein